MSSTAIHGVQGSFREHVNDCRARVAGGGLQGPPRSKEDAEADGTVTYPHYPKVETLLASLKTIAFAILLAGLWRRKAMTQLDDRTAANLEVVLEDACRALPHGGDHLFRKRIARRLLSAARHGQTTLASLGAVARSASVEAMKRRSV